MSGLPGGWEWTVLKDLISSIEAGKSFRCEERPPVGTEPGLVKISAVTKGVFNEAQSKTVLDLGLLDEAARIGAGDFLMSRANTIELVGACAIVETIQRNLYLSDKVLRLRMPDSFKPWVMNWLKTEQGRTEIEERSSGNQLSMRNIGQESIRSIPVPLAPLPEQRRIVEKIEALTARSRRAREALDSLPALIDRYRQSILAAAFRGDLTAEWRQHKSLTCVPDEYFHSASRRQGSRVTLGEQRAVEADHASMPPSWKKVLVRDVARLQPGYAFKSSWFAKSGVRLLRGTNIVPDGTRWDDTVFLPEDVAADYSGYQLSEGDIIIAMDRPLISSGLKVARVSRNDLPALLLQRVGRFHLSKAIMPGFFWLYLHTFQFIRHILGQATGSDLPHISAADIESAPLYVPSLDEQRKIIEVTGEDKLLNAVSASASFARDRLATLDQSILAKAFRGELVPQDPNDEPASVLLERIRAERAAAGAAPRRGRRGKGA